MNDYSKITDEELMVLLTHSAQSSKQAAFEEIYKRYSQRLLTYFNFMLNDRDKSEDFLHDLFIKILDKAILFNPEKKFSVWVYTVAMNMCKNEFRSIKIKKNKTLSSEEIQIRDDEKLDESKIYRKRLRQEVEKLDEIHKTTFILRYNLNMSLKEISDIMDCNEGTVKSRLFYTTKKLTENLKNFQ